MKKGGEKSHRCPMCASSFTNSVDLKRHILVHTGEKPFSCKQCEYKCTTNGNLKSHMLTHSGEKPFTFWVEWIIVSFLSPGPGIGVWYFILVKPIFFSHVYVLCGYVEDFSNRKVSPGSKDSILHFIIVFNVSWFVWKEHLVFVFQNTFVDSDYFYLFNQVI